MKRIMRQLVILLALCFFCTGVAYAEELEGQSAEQQGKNALESSNLQIEKSSLTGIYDLQISNVNVDGVTCVRFAIWSDANGQDDLRWYDAFSKGDGTYSYSFSLVQHKGLGKYHVHAYAVTKDGLTILERGTFDVTAPVISEVFIDNVDDIKGTFQAYVREIENAEYIQKVQFAVWSEVNGQDDIIWYDADSDGNGGYVKNINVSSHKYSLGKYQIHVYITDITGDSYYAGKVSQDINIQNGNMSVKKGQEDNTYTVELNNLVVPGGISEVLIPTWSKINGQDDIQWYSAKKTEDYSYQTNISLKNHKGFGDYYVHAYVRTKGGELVCVGRESFSIAAPKLGNMYVKNYDKEKGTFQIVISDIENIELIQAIQIPTWSASGGQDDINWYQAKKTTQGEYIIDVNIRDHKYTMGEYIAHAYITDITGCFYYAKAVTHSVVIETGELTVTQGESNKRQYSIEIKNVCVPGGVEEIQFPIWSAVGGQDDIYWYKASKQVDGSYQLKMSLENHKGLGLFNVHLYAKMPNGSLNYIGKTTFETKSPKIGEVSIFNEKKMAGEFQVKITGVENDELIEKIQVPIWSEKNQEDIVWYTAIRNNDGDYVVNVNISNHKYNTGIYNVHVYLTDVTGGMECVGRTTCNMQAEYSNFSAENKDGIEKNYKITLNGLKVPAGEKSITFAVWGNVSGQNDIHWYTANKDSDGEYSYTVSIRNHKELGLYYVHAYCITKANGLSYVGATSFSVEKIPQMASATISEVDGTKGTFKVTVTGLMAPSGIEKVQIPVWCVGDQSDIKWYDAIKVSESTYMANVKVENHAHHFGDYKVHIYATMGNGIMTMVGATNAHIEAENYVYSRYINSMQREVVLLGATANRVQFPTWSEAYGQDDIVWYEGINCGNGKWSAIVNSSNHYSAGNYITHVYVMNASGSICVGGLSYSLNRLPADQAAMKARANLYGSPTPYIIMVNRSTHKVGVFQGWQGNWNLIQYWDCADGKPSTPTVEGVFSVGSRGYYFNSGAYRCYWWTQFYGDYLFHSVLYDWNGVLQDGRVGVALSHGCVRLQIDKAKWIYDTIPSRTTVVVYH